MHFETAKKFIDYILNSELKLSDGVILEFIGGEPLLEVELIDKIYDYFLLTAYEKNTSGTGTIALVSVLMALTILLSQCKNLFRKIIPKYPWGLRLMVLKKNMICSAFFLMEVDHLRLSI